MVVDAVLLAAIRRARDRLGGAELARACDFGQSVLTRILSGETKEISEKTLSRLYPHIKEYLPAGPTYVPRDVLLAAKPAPPSPLPPGNAVEVGVREVPIYGFGNAAPGSGELYGDVVPDGEHHLDRTYTTDASVIAAFRVVGQSMEPDGIFDGSVVYCRRVDDPRELPPGAIVVCKVDDHLYCKHWRVVGSTILLTSSAPGGKDLELTESAPEWTLRAVDVLKHLNGR